MPYKLTAKIVIIFILFFILTFFENAYIGGVSFASVWKAPVVLYLIYYTYFLNSSNSSKFIIITLGGLFCLKLLIHTNSFFSILPEITNLLKYIIIPALFYYLIAKYKNKPGEIIKFLFWMSIVLIWNNVPYLFHFIEPKVQKDYSQAFGDDMLVDAGFSGPYMTIHNQAVYMASACLYIIFLVYKFPRKFSIRSPYILLTLVIGLYCLFLSFARTGWLLFALGLLIIFFKELNRKHFGKTVLLLSFSVLGVVYLFETNDSFRKRILDERQYSSGNEKFDVGSGRLVIGTTALANWWSSGFNSILIGYGTDMGKDKMKKKLGSRIFAHNSYIEILQTSGVIGFLLFILFIIYFYFFIKKIKSTVSNLLTAFFAGWLVVGSVQTFDFVYFNVFISGTMAFSYLLYKRKNVNYKIIKKQKVINEYI